jgi:pSer/pThr/pTyr-binding forkhead associated (FHA) protein
MKVHPQPGGPTVRLQLVGEGRSVLLCPGRIVLGRDAACDVRFDSPRVSRRHGVITVDHRGAFLEDLGSKNGTFVGGRLVEGRVSLAEGDEIHLGHHAVTLHVARARPDRRGQSSGGDVFHRFFIEPE